MLLPKTNIRVAMRKGNKYTTRMCAFDFVVPKPNPHVQADRDFTTRTGHIEQASNRGPIQQSAFTLPAKHISPDAIFNVLVCHCLHPSCLLWWSPVLAVLAQQHSTAYCITTMHSILHNSNVQSMLHNNKAQQQCTAKLLMLSFALLK